MVSTNQSIVSYVLWGGVLFVQRNCERDFLSMALFEFVLDGVAE